MSLIENAISRARNLGAAPAVVAPPRRLIRRAALLAADAPPARTFTRAAVDKSAMAASNILHYVSDDYAQRAYKVLRTRVLKRMESNGWHSVAVTSAAPGDGKTLTAINLALALAQDTATSVFLVDLDLQRPTVARYLGLKHGPGLSQYLAGEATKEQIVYDPVGIERLSVVPNAQALHNSSDLLRSERMGNLVTFLEAEAPRRIIVYDMPPALVGDDVMAFGAYVDSVLLVVSEGKTSRVALENARNVVADMNLIGVVLNNATQSKDEAYAYY
jgi:capsular exopolysaccharide synthesis family protein